MKLKVKYLLSSPFIAISAYIFLIYIPYLYPVFHFPFKKVYGFWAHTLLCIVIVLLIFIARVFSQYPNLRLRKFETPPIFIPKVSRKWFYIALFFLLISLLMNTLIGINGYLSYDGNIHTSKRSLEDFGGINILSQLSLFFVVPYLIYIYQNKFRWAWGILILLIVVIAIRSYYMAERLALLEFLIPLFITYLTLKGTKVSVVKLVKYFLILLSFFMFLELTRQFKNQYEDESVDLGFKVSWTLERFFAYYGDTQNKFYFVIDNGLSFTTINYLSSSERILSRLGLDLPSQVDNINYGEYVWKDFTNQGGLKIAYTDFGLILGSIFFISFFMVFFVLWFRLKKGSLYAWSVYPFFFIWIVEFTRYNAIFLTRYVIPFVFFSSIYILIRSVKVNKITHS